MSLKINVHAGSPMHSVCAARQPLQRTSASALKCMLRRSPALQTGEVQRHSAVLTPAVPCSVPHLMVIEPLMLQTRGAALPVTMTASHALLLSRLLVEELDIGAVQLTLDIHVAEASPQRIPLDAHATPVSPHAAAATLMYVAHGEASADEHCCTCPMVVVG